MEQRSNNKKKNLQIISKQTTKWSLGTGRQILYGLKSTIK